MSHNDINHRNTLEHRDFDHPSFWFVLEDKIKSLFGGSLYHNSDIKSLRLKGDESILDFGCGGGVTIRVLISI